MKEALIIFVKNPQLGKVKTRIAKTVGNEQALFIYKELLSKTCLVTQDWKGDKYVFYDEFIDEQDLWPSSEYFKRLQVNGDLGAKMFKAFATLFDQYDKLVIIGSDCYQLTASLIKEAFEKLDKVDVVLGPAMDGGYYLLGLRTLHFDLFDKIPWSTDKVLELTKDKISQLDLSSAEIQTLKDIDHYEDWVEQTKMN